MRLRARTPHKPALVETAYDAGGASLAGNNVSYSVKAKYRIVHHDAEYKTVHHDAVTHTETYCTGCGVIW